jgi:hypothetical protein
MTVDNFPENVPGMHRGGHEWMVLLTFHGTAGLVVDVSPPFPAHGGRFVDNPGFSLF